MNDTVRNFYFVSVYRTRHIARFICRKEALIVQQQIFQISTCFIIQLDKTFFNDEEVVIVQRLYY
jgi:hypothetical protein